MPSSVETECDPDEHFRFLFAGSVGSVGRLKEWLERALYACFAGGRNTITLADLEAARMRRGQLLKIIEENDRGLAELRLLDSSDTELEKAMRMRPVDKGAAASHEALLLPGTRKPVRDPVDAATAA